MRVVRLRYDLNVWIIKMEAYRLTFLIATATAAIISDGVICGTDCIIIDGVAGRTAKHLIIFTTHR